MASKTVVVIDGPDKPALQWSAAYPERKVDVQFKTEDDAFDVRISEMAETPTDAFAFRIVGEVMSGPYKGAVCHGIYSVGDRTGSLTLETRRSASAASASE